MNLAFDKIGIKPHPNLSRWQARPYTPEWRQFSNQWPYSEPLHFLEYLDQEKIAYQLYQSQVAPYRSLYPVSISFFHFSVDWFDIMPRDTFDKIRNGILTLWFFYSEGDNPFRIKEHLDKLCDQYDVPGYVFTSANSKSNYKMSLDVNRRWTHFVDDELLYRLRNEEPAVDYHENSRSKKFTALVRTHKWWRATTMARLWCQGYSKDGYFSYNNALDVGDKETDNPIQIDRIPGMRKATYDFLDQCPFLADEFDSDYHNLYHYTVREHFENSYLNIVLETHLDTDQSGGAFLTEKSFKPIKNSQLFIIVGAPGSVQQLRNMGYKTFDNVMNHRYDKIKNNSARWNACCIEIMRLLNSNLHELYKECKDQIIYNQQLFLSDKQDRLNTLIRSLHGNS